MAARRDRSRSTTPAPTRGGGGGAPDPEGPLKIVSFNIGAKGLRHFTGPRAGDFAERLQGDLAFFTSKFGVVALQEVSGNWTQRISEWLPLGWQAERDACHEQALVMVWGPSVRALPCANTGRSTESTRVFAPGPSQYRDWRRHQVAVFQKRSGTTYVVSNSHTINGTGYRTIPGSGPKAIRFGQQALQAAVEAVQAKARGLARSSTHSVAWVVIGDFNMTKEAARSLLQEMPRKIVEGAVLAGHARRDLVVAGGQLACIETFVQDRINLLPPC